MPQAESASPGLVVLFGSGETSASGQKVFDWLFRQLDPPLRVSILETPAGFELNSSRVAGRIGEFLTERLQNYRPQVTLVPARRRGTLYSPDVPEVVAPLFDSDVIFLGPGSPTYTVRQLQDTLAWHALLARHHLGAAVVLASAATVAAGRYALPVYEIYKAGEDLHWREGLDFFGGFGLSLSFVPHWNNHDGGEELDTSRCYMGRARFDALRSLLPPEATFVGIDEHTALAIDLLKGTCRVLGRGGVTLVRDGAEMAVSHGHHFELAELGRASWQEQPSKVPLAVWQQAKAAASQEVLADGHAPPAWIQDLAAQREAARGRREWLNADDLRRQIEAQGWRVQDTPDGQQLLRA